MRTTSPIQSSVLPKVYEKIGADQRDNIIRKLKQELILSRGKSKQVAILQHYLLNLHSKVNALQQEKLKIQDQNRSRLQYTNKAINDEKRQLERLKSQTKKQSKQLEGEQEMQIELKKALDQKVIEIEKLKKQGDILISEYQKLVQENYRLKTQQQTNSAENKRIEVSIDHLFVRNKQVQAKVSQAKQYLCNLNEDHMVLQEKLKVYELENNEIGQGIDHKTGTIDRLEELFSYQHDKIKSQVQHFIQIQHQNDKIVQQIRHKVNLVRIENQKSAELHNLLSNVERNTKDRIEEIHTISKENMEIELEIQQVTEANMIMKRDLINCQQHLQSLVAHNGYLHKELDNYILQDEAIIELIKYKRKNLPANIKQNYKLNSTGNKKY